MDNLSAYIKKASLIVFNATAIVGIIGYFLDIIGFINSSSVLLYNNIFVITATLVGFLLYHAKVLKLGTGYAIIVYAALLNVLFDIFTDIQSDFNLYFFLRDSLFIILVLTLAALIASKFHALVISGIYITATVVFNYIIDNEFLQASIGMIILYVSAYSVVVYIFVGILEKSIIDRERKEKVIIDQNESLLEANLRLERNKNQIEEQAEELKSANEMLNSQNRELTELNAVKNKFFSIIGHDLKNPLSAILGFSEILSNRAGRLSEEKKALYFKKLAGSARQSFTLLENLLDWARSQGDQLEIRPVSISLTELAESNILLLNESIKKKEIKISFECSDGRYLALCDKNMADVVIRNLLYNAVKFTGKGGEISIRMKKDIKRKVIQTEISDTGIGIEAEDIDKLFSLDRNFSTEGTIGETGTGLGLILSKEFIEKNKGEIWVESKRGKGSTFAFTLPLAQ